MSPTVSVCDRYREWDDPTGETPPYHYGTHYSSAMIVCSYLVRLEPFSTHFLRLQVGQTAADPARLRTRLLGGRVSGGGGYRRRRLDFAQCWKFDFEFWRYGVKLLVKQGFE